MTPIKRFPIVVALDGSEYSEIVAEHAFDQAARHDRPDLHFITVVKPKEKDIEPTKDWLSRVVVEGLETFRDGRDWHARIHVRAGDPAEEIANLAEEISAQLIVVGRYGTHRGHSVPERLLDLTASPTLCVGLSGVEVDPVPQCPDCVAVRADSDGERWFCAAHAAPDRVRLSLLVPPITAERGTIY
jgi:nucleotide-binding universal stress UspA family protein